MNSNNTQSLKTCIKHIINGIFYERKKMGGGYFNNAMKFEVGMINNRPADYVVNLDNHSLLKSGIRTIMIENNYELKR